MKFMYSEAMGLYLLIVIIFQLSLQLLGSQELNGAPQLLTQYDGTSSSSSFGEPILRLEPPNVINFANTQGTTILCLASGSPRPIVNWYSSSDFTQATTSGQMMFGGEMSLQQSRPVNNVTNLRLIMNNGALLRLLPFKEADFRQDIHSTEYRCVASNKLATIHSRSVLVQAVMSNGSGSGSSGTASEISIGQQQMEVKVSDEFVALNSVAVFKCRANSGPEFSQLIGWFTSDGIQIRPSDTSKANKFMAFKSGELHVNNVDMLDLQRTYGCPNKFMAFKSGELHVNNVDMLDLQRTYGCRMRNSITNRIASSSGLAQLIVTDPLESAARDGSSMANGDPAAASAAASFRFAPQVVHSVSQLIMIDPFYQQQQQQQHAQRNTQATESHQSNWRLLLPCAVRGLPARELRWFFQANSGRGASGGGGSNLKPVPLDQWASLESIGLQYLHSPTSGHNPGQNSSSAGAAGKQQHPSSSHHHQRTNFIVGPTFLAIDRPTRGQSGRYTCQWAPHQQAETVCDINVIIRQPIKLTMKASIGGGGGGGASSSDYQAPDGDYSYYAPAQSRTSDHQHHHHQQQQSKQQQASWLSQLAFDWLGWPKQQQQQQQLPEAAKRLPARRNRETGEEDMTQSSPAAPTSGPPSSSASSNPLIEGDARRVQVRGPGAIEAPPVVRVGQRLRLDCHGWGHPIEGVKWFRNGVAINTQSSNDFQIEITSPTLLLEEQVVGGPNAGGGGGDMAQPLSSLIIRQVQPKEIGLNVFECFAHNSLGDRARAGQVVFVAEPALLDWARAACPVGAAATGNGTSTWPPSGPYSGNNLDGGGDNESSDYATLDEDDGDRLDYSGRGPAGHLAFRRNNPLRRALILEAEPIELRCPIQQQTNLPQSRSQQQQQQHHHQHHQHLSRPASHGPRVEWRQLVASHPGSGDPTNRQATSGAGAAADPPGARSLNQLFGGDSRFVINGSSLHIRSPSKRYDEALYVCRPSWPSSQAAGEPSAGSSGQQEQAGTVAASLLLSAPTSQVHQSSLAPPSGPSTSSSPASSAYSISGHQLQPYHCDSMLEATLFRGPAEQPQNQQRPGYMRPPPPTPLPISSISIRIVGKPKIDPFEFSRNLEEGMRAVVVCAVISGQSPVDITWFKDGEYLLADEQITIDQSNGFSSTLTFHRIRPAHMGLYTCIAANAYASTNHTSKLIVNVAPYLIDPPQNTRAILGTNVLINCQAAGQPSPQIRWRKLVPIGGSTGSGTNSPSSINAKQVAPASGSKARQFHLYGSAGGINEFDLATATASANAQSVNTNDLFGLNQIDSFDGSGGSNGGPSLGNNKFEFRIVTSNSHIQILENGSMIIKEVELGDASWYVCQAFNGINPSLSKVIELTVLSPAQFGVHYETVSAKRDSMIKFNCAPKGDQPMQIEWYKEGNRLILPQAAAAAAAETASATNNSNQQQLMMPNKYNEIAHLYNGNRATQERHSGLVIQQLQQQQPASNQTTGPRPPSSTSGSPVQGEGMVMSELLISYADRGDTGAFVCVAQNAYGKDELTYRLIVQEPPDVPALVQAQNVQANSLKLVWGTPFDGNLPLSHFVIEYRRLMGPSNKELLQVSGMNPAATTTTTGVAGGGHNEWTRIVVSTGQLLSSQSEHQLLQLTTSSNQIAQQVAKSSQQQQLQQQPSTGSQYSLALRQLSAKSTYHIRVAALNAIGQSGFSSPIVVTTAEEPPSGRPDDLRAQPVSSSSIRVLWRGPALVEEQAPVKGYYVSHRKLSPAARQQPSLPPETGNGGAKEDEQQSKLMVASATQQQLWLATSSIGASNLTNYNRAQDQDQMGSSIQQQQVGGSGQLIKSVNPNGANYEFMLIGLDKDTKYEIRVQPYNSMGVGPASDTIGQTLKFDRPGQPNLKLISSRKQSFELKWTIADDQPLMGFSLFYKCEYDDWQEIQLGIIYHYVIENLRCGNKYQIYLSAFNVVGRSDPSDVLSVRTEGTAPQAPAKGQFVRSNITEVILDMSGWQSGGCPISSFMIQFKRLHDSNWFILSEGVTPFAMSDKITIPDLAPATWYKLLVTALNEAGSTNAEYLFSTLTTGGKQVAPLDGGLGGGHELATNAVDRGMLSGLNQLFFTSGSGNNQDQAQLLLPMSCILLLVVTLLASYLYYSRSGGQRTPASEQRKLTGGSRPAAAAAAAAASMAPHQLMMDQIHLHGCRSETNTLSRDEKQLIQSDHHNNYHHHLLHHQLMGASTLPLDAGQQQRMASNLDGGGGGGDIQQSAPTDSMLDSLLINNATFHSLTMGSSNSNQKPQQQQQQQRIHGMRLLSTGNIFSPIQSNGNGNGIVTGSNCTNSSLSTQSTNCTNFDCGASSSQASSSGISGCGMRAKAKLQLIDESSLISSPPSNNNNINQETTMEHQNFVYGHLQQQPQPVFPVACHMSPSHQQQQQQLYSSSGPTHVDLINSNGGEATVVDTANQLIEGNLLTGGDFQNGCNNNNNSNINISGTNRFYSGPRLVSTSSFASAADLLQRQQKMYQKQQQHHEEPIYQRLDNFQAANGLPVSKQQQFAYNKSNTIHFNSSNHVSSMENPGILRSMTLHRAQPMCLGGDGQYPNGLYLPANNENPPHDTCHEMNR